MNASESLVCPQESVTQSLRNKSLTATRVARNRAHALREIFTFPWI